MAEKGAGRFWIHIVVVLVIAGAAFALGAVYGRQSGPRAIPEVERFCTADAESATGLVGWPMACVRGDQQACRLRDLHGAICRSP